MMLKGHNWFFKGYNSYELRRISMKVMGNDFTCEILDDKDDDTQADVIQLTPAWD